MPKLELSRDQLRRLMQLIRFANVIVTPLERGIVAEIERAYAEPEIVELEGADTDALLASLEQSASPETMALRSARAKIALAYVMSPKAERNLRGLDSLRVAADKAVADLTQNERKVMNERFGHDVCIGGCSRGGDGPRCGKTGCRG